MIQEKIIFMTHIIKYNIRNVFDKHVGWLNLEMDRLINLTKESIDQKIPVWFGCDMGAETDSSSE